MKKLLSVLLAAVLVLSLSSCFFEANSQKSVTRVFKTNYKVITEAVETGDFSKAEKIWGIQDIQTGEGVIDFQCGGKGFGPETSYYGFFYSPDDSFNTAIMGYIPKEEFVESGNGFLWEEENGDNSFYIEKLDEHFYYYELHF